MEATGEREKKKLTLLYVPFKQVPMSLTLR